MTIGGVQIHNIGLARVHAHFQNTLPQIAGAHRIKDLAAVGVFQLPAVIGIGIAHRGLNLGHEVVRNAHAVVKI